MKFFGRKKSEEKDPNGRFVMQNIIVSILAALLCIAAFSGTTWAWFATSIQSSSQSLEMAFCEVDVSVQKIVIDENVAGGSTFEPVMGREYMDGESFILEADATYLVSLASSGTASTCYAKLIVCGNTYVTEQITVPTSISFTLSFDDATEVVILPGFGTSSASFRAINDGGNYTDETFGITASQEVGEPDPADLESVTDEPVADEPAMEEPTTEEPTTEEPTTEEPTTEEPQTE